MSSHFDALEPEVRRRFELLREMLGLDDEEALVAARVAAKSQKEGIGRNDVEELLHALADGSGITVHEARDLLRTMYALLSAGGGTETKEAAEVATKSERARRDRQGRRLDKPHGLSPEREDEGGGPRRDHAGRRLRKPFDPRNTRR